MGFPIQRSPALSLFSGSPKLIAAYHVFHRLLAPRHPPYALSNLTINLKNTDVKVEIYVKVNFSTLAIALTFNDRCHHPFIHIQLSKNKKYFFQTGWKDFLRSTPHLILVEMSGFEPPTPCVQGRCSPAELHPQNPRKFQVQSFKFLTSNLKLYNFKLWLVGLDRVELSTSRLSGVRSNQLSYRPSF